MDASPLFPLFVEATESIRRADTREPSVYRPVQYLGSKLRSLPALVTAAADLGVKNGRVVDLFTGTSVVAQAFAANGFRVTAVDTQLASQTMATALLGFGRGKSAISFEIAQEVVKSAEALRLEAPWIKLISAEQRAIQVGDSAALHELNRKVPLLWHSSSRFAPRKQLLKSSGELAVGIAPLFALTLAGSYFGVKQALTIDALRWAIEHFHRAGKLSDWQSSALLTALMAAMSKAVYSAGKHFAQPLTAGQGNGGHFRSRRMLDDRAIDVQLEFLRGAALVSAHARAGSEGHIVSGTLAEDALLSIEAPSLVYADPPYTAQQYSRFYHALDTLVSYRVPSFDPGQLTTGLYPPNRFKSAFCSKRKAHAAFDRVLSAARTKRASLLLSYSVSAKGSDGNDRMVSLDEILRMCRRYYGTRFVKLIKLDHVFRQFNAERYSNTRRSDPEILIACGC